MMAHEERAAGAKLGNLTNLREAGAMGRVQQSEAASRFVIEFLPVLCAVQRGGATDLKEITDALNDRNIRSASGVAGTAPRPAIC